MKKIFLITISLFISTIIIYGQRDFIITEKGKKRVALVIGNSNYKNATSLKNPINDAIDMKKSLEKVGFEVISLYDANRAETINKIRVFKNKISEQNTVALFYYAGHGLQANEDNWIVPIDANPQSEAEIQISCISLSYLMDNLNDANSDVNIIILDACRNNPFRYVGRSTTGGLMQPKITPKGTFIAFSTSPGTVASDGYGRNSPYTTELKKAILTPNITIEKAFKNVRLSLTKQTSWENSSLIGDFYFNPTDGDEQEDKDSDGDGILDNIDECPYEYGKISNKGCPSNLPTNNLIAYYPFNGNAKDESGNGNHGKSYGGVSPTMDRNGKSNSAFRFDGINDEVVISNPFGYRINNRKALSISFWVKMNSTKSYNTMISFNTACQNTTDDYFHVTSYGKVGGFPNTCFLGFQYKPLSFPIYKITDNSWHNIIFSYDGNKVSLYLDGNKISSTYISSNHNIDETINLVIGNNHITKCSGNHNFRGAIDDVRIYSKALNYTEIKALANE